MKGAGMVVIAGVLVAALANAQERAGATRYETPFGRMWTQNVRPEPEGVKFRLWLGYPDAGSEYQDQLDYVLSLQSRWATKGLQVGVVMPTAEAEKLAATGPQVLVVGPSADDEQANSNILEHLNGLTFLMNDDDFMLVAMSTPDGIEDVLRALNDKQGLNTVNSAKARLDPLLQIVGDGGHIGPQVEQSLKAMPKSGRAHAAKVLYHWWCQGDLQAAHEAVAVALSELADHSLPLSTFADLVVRGDHEDPDIAGLVAKALAPIAKDAKHGTFTQLVYLRALLKSRRDARTAGRIAAILPKRLKGQPKSLVIFAETLMDGETPEIYRDAAERALKSAEVDPKLKRWVLCARHKILKRCGDDDGAARLMEIYRKNPVGRGDLNDDAWYLIVQPQTMGRFDTLALAQALKMQEVQANRISVNSKDTLALALFRGGHIAKAIDLQKETKPKTNAAYLGRFQRYEAVLAQRKAKIEQAKANK